MPNLQTLLAQSAALHNHLCPRQVLGVQMGIYAGELLGLVLPQENKRLYALIETDGCFADGVAVASGCWLGHRTMRLLDYGKVAATFYDSQTERAVRLAPRPEIRSRAAALYPEARSRWHAQLESYQHLTPAELFKVQSVSLTLDMHAVISRAGVRVNCAACGEEILNEREVLVNGELVCRSCAGEGYYVIARPEVAYAG
ncbi:MAG: formylmethanofuran dehydrogenase [Chloroflexi bacterium CFX4]|nr:formylmethanofuran dehydrogenase [Chloroflexi bacterium CFX4]MDL1923937.1 formylmethanofuran dehydrogenase [Chloroflexi bacterium CFX3]